MKQHRVHRVAFAIWFLVTSLLVAEEIFPIDQTPVSARFKPLEFNEQLKYSISSDGRNVVSIVGVGSDSGPVRLIGEWQGVDEWNGLQLASNRRKCIVAVTDDHEAGLSTLFFVDGDLGMISRIDSIPQGFRSTGDSRFLVYRNQDDPEVIDIYSVFGRSVVCHVNSPFSLGGVEVGFGGFKRLGEREILVMISGDGGIVVATFAVDPDRGITKVLIDLRTSHGPFPKDSNPEFQDSIDLQWKNDRIKVGSVSP